MVLDSVTGKKLLRVEPMPTQPADKMAIINKSPTKLNRTKKRINDAMA